MATARRRARKRHAAAAVGPAWSRPAVGAGRRTWSRQRRDVTGVAARHGYRPSDEDVGEKGRLGEEPMTIRAQVGKGKASRRPR